MANTLQYTDTLTIIECGECHIPFAIPQNLYRARTKDGQRFYCPNGHFICWSDNENTRLKARLDQAEADAAWQRRRGDRLNEEALFERRRASALKGHLTRMRRRVANGVCPVPGCKRSFTQVQEHVKTQHAEWLHEHPEVFDG